MELVAQAGYNPLDYIRFYNLRNYDRINAGTLLQKAEQQSGVAYEEARRYHDDALGAGFGGKGEGTGATAGNPGTPFRQYEAAARVLASPGYERWDSVSECYMLSNTDLRNVPFDGPPNVEVNNFVSEELYIHSKVFGIMRDCTKLR